MDILFSSCFSFFGLDSFLSGVTPLLAQAQQAGDPASVAEAAETAREYYLHDLDPVIFHITGRLAIRWYGLAYVLGFIGGYFLLRYLVRKGCSELRENQVGDFITYAALFGVMLGGRLGYMLFYNPYEFFRNPLIFFNFLEGGMSSHGGILGVVIFAWVYARRHRLSWPGLGDNLVVVAPVGLFCGRMANFINGELYGRPSTVPWAVQFPTELREGVTFRQEQFAALKAMIGDFSLTREEVIARATSDPAIESALRAVLQPRHPSQIYEALLEGLLLFVILFAVRMRWKRLYHGIITGLFFIFYAVFRIAVENFREPDASRILGLTRGQFYSLFMVAIGVAFIVHALNKRRGNGDVAEAIETRKNGKKNRKLKKGDGKKNSEATAGEAG